MVLDHHYSTIGRVGGSTTEKHVVEEKIKEIRLQFSEQLKALEARTETQQCVLTELQEYYRREGWSQHTMTSLWLDLVETTKQEAKDRSCMADLYSNHVIAKLNNQSDDIARIARKCRESGMSAHGEISRVLNELHTAMKTYQLCHAESCAAETKFRASEQQKAKFEAEHPAKVGSSRKHRFLEKEFEKKQGKYQEMRLKGLKARNEYLLCIDAANAALHKYFADDLSDLIDCMDLGLQQWLSSLLATIMAARKSITETESESLSRIRDFAETLDSRADKQKFLEANHANFMLPRKFEFRPHGDDEIRQVSANKPIQEELIQRLTQMERRLVDLKTETEEVWKTLESAESKVLELQQQPVVVIPDLFTMGGSNGMISQTSPYASSTLQPGSSNVDIHKRSFCREPEIPQQKRKQNLAETEDFYMEKFQEYLLTGNLIRRLQARSDAIRGSLGGARISFHSADWNQGDMMVNGHGNNNNSSSTGHEHQYLQQLGSRPNRLTFSRQDSLDSEGPTTPLSSADGSETDHQQHQSSATGNVDRHQQQHRPPTLPPKPRKKRIGDSGRMESGKRPKLFGGSLEEYVEVTGEEIPEIVQSCIRMLSTYGLHHQGVFRVSGSQLEISNFKEAFERGEDPLCESVDGNDVNSAAGCLKAYFRELREPLFPIYMFDQFTDCTQCNKSEFLGRFKELIASLPRATILVLRYLFAFLNHLSEFSDENMMDPYNLAICFGPTLMPIPDGKDQVLYHNHVNELMRNLIVHHDILFPASIDGPIYQKYALAETSNEDPLDENMLRAGLMSLSINDPNIPVIDASQDEDFNPHQQLSVEEQAEGGNNNNNNNEEYASVGGEQNEDNEQHHQQQHPSAEQSRSLTAFENNHPSSSSAVHQQSNHRHHSYDKQQQQRLRLPAEHLTSSSVGTNDHQVIAGDSNANDASNRQSHHHQYHHSDATNNATETSAVGTSSVSPQVRPRSHVPSPSPKPASVISQHHKSTNSSSTETDQHPLHNQQPHPNLDLIDPNYEVWHPRAPTQMQNRSNGNSPSVKLTLHKVAPAMTTSTDNSSSTNSGSRWDSNKRQHDRQQSITSNSSSANIQPQPIPNPRLSTTSASGTANNISSAKRLSLQPPATSSQSSTPRGGSSTAKMTLSQYSNPGDDRSTSASYPNNPEDDMSDGCPESITEIQSELKAVLSSLEHFTTVANQAKDAPDLVQNLPDLKQMTSGGVGDYERKQSSTTDGIPGIMMMNPTVGSRLGSVGGGGNGPKQKSPAPKPPIAKKPAPPPPSSTASPSMA